MDNAELPSPIRFYLGLIRVIPRALWDALGWFGNVALAVLGLLFLCNRPLAKLVSSWHGISPWWAVVPFATLIAIGLVRANYERYRDLHNDRTAERTRSKGLHEDLERERNRPPAVTTAPQATAVAASGDTKIDSIINPQAKAWTEGGKDRLQISLEGLKAELHGGEIVIGRIALPGLPQQERVEGQEIRLTDLVNPYDPVLRNYRFEEQTILGPAILVPVAVMEIGGDTKWLFPLSDVEAVIWQHAEGPVSGAMGVENTSFISCRFIHVGIADGDGNISTALRKARTTGGERPGSESQL